MSTGITETDATAAKKPASSGTGDGQPVLRSARRAGLIDQVIEQLRERITTGDWAVGSRIPTESELAQMTDTSRNTVREAVQSLVHAGLLERRQGSGTYVLAASELAGAVSRRVAAARHHHVLEVRRALEAGAARLAAVRRTDEDVIILRTLLTSRSEAREGGDIDAVVRIDVDLHRAIVRATHNPVLEELYENLVGALQENVRRNVLSVEEDDDHADLVQAIVDGQADRAAHEASRFLEELLDADEPTD